MQAHKQRNVDIFAIVLMLLFTIGLMLFIHATKEEEKYAGSDFGTGQKAK